MPVIPRHLVTTSDERSWGIGGPLLFLGEWCRLYDKAKHWSGLDAIVAEPFIFPAKDKKLHIDYVQEMCGILLREMTVALNEFHGVSHSQRYWDILLGYWLQRYVAVSFNRYYSIKQVMDRYKVKSTSVLALEKYTLATDDSGTFLGACNDPLWNHIFYKHVLLHLGGCELEYVSLDGGGVDDIGFCPKKAPTKRKIFYKQGMQFIKHLLLLFKRKNDALILNTYLPRWLELMLNLSLGQCPQLWQSPSIQPTPLNIEMRNNFRIKSDGYTDFEKFVRELLSNALPICYLEGYSKLCNQAESLPWPTNPKFIFTSNNFDTDEIFKAWTAKKIEQKIPYYVGQHGGQYGTNMYIGNEKWPLRQSVDNFITWGWENNKTNEIPAFIFKTAGKKQRQKSVIGDLLLMEVYQQSLCNPFDTYYEHGVYCEEQFKFVNALPTKIRKKLKVRLHDAWINTSWHDDKRWADFDSSVRIDPGVIPVERAISHSRLVVHSYDSTGILETLSLNIPTVCFWHGGLENHLLPEAKPYYELLRGVGIIADSPKQAAETVALYWDDIDKWWGSEEVQYVRILFCEQYAKSVNNPVTNLKDLLCKATNTFESNIQKS